MSGGKNFSHPLRSTAVYLIIAGLLTLAQSLSVAYAQDSANNTVKASKILQFIEYFKWPDDRDIHTIKLGIYKGGDAVSDAVIALGNVHQAKKGRAIQISLVADMADLVQYQLVFIPHAQTQVLDRIARVTRRTGTLLISDGAANKRDQMINFLQGSPAAFEINRTNIEHERITLDTGILKLGGTELDVADLNKNIVNELEDLKGGLEVARRQFLIQNEEIAFLRQQAARTELNISNMRRETLLLEEQVNQKNTELQHAQNNVDRLQQSFVEGQQALEALQGELQGSSDALTEQTQKLSALQLVLANRSNEAAAQEKLMRENRARITSQNATLATQETNLRQQNTIITSQQNWLMVAAAAIVAISLLLGRIIQNGRRIRLLNAELSLAKDELENRVLARTADLTMATDQAIRASQAKSDFLSNMSHELRTPLNAIIGFSTMLKDQIYGKIEDPRYAEYAGLIKTSGDHLLGIITEILDLTRIETGKMKLNESAFSPANAVNECLDIFNPTAQGKQQRITFTAPTAQAFLYADRQFFCQMLLNLLGNAGKFSPEGSVIVIEMSVDLKAGLQLTVTDEGIGIASDQIALVSQPFVQAESTMQRSYPGVGLGLTLVTSMIKLHGGTIEIQSKEGEGTSVQLTYPATRIISEPASSDISSDYEIN